MQKLHKCPFCLGDAKLVHDYSWGYYDNVFVKCQECGTKTKNFNGNHWSQDGGNINVADEAKAQAIAHWNGWVENAKYAT